MNKLENNLFVDYRGSLSCIPHDVLDRHWANTTIATNTQNHTFRGMHYQSPEQEKYVQVVHGKIVDFQMCLETKAVDYVFLNKGESVFIDSDKAHGYLTLEPNTIVLYFTSEDYNLETQHSVKWREIEEINRVIRGLTYGNVITSKKDS
jgi:dTDP-4-dehydrorhamnose 3,5-epimerase-like enzyme